MVAKSGSGSNVRLIWNQAFDQDAGDVDRLLRADGERHRRQHGGRAGHELHDDGTGLGHHVRLLGHRLQQPRRRIESSGAIGGTARAGRLSTSFTTPAGSIARHADCSNGDTDTDGDRLPDWAETNTGVFVSVANTGTNPNVADSDGDGIKDGDETLGTLTGLNLPTLGASPNTRTSPWSSTGSTTTPSPPPVAPTATDRPRRSSRPSRTPTPTRP